MSATGDSLGVVPTVELLEQLAALGSSNSGKQHEEAAQFVADYHALLADDVAERDRQAALAVGGGTRGSGRTGAATSALLASVPPPVMAAYMFVPLSLVRAVVAAAAVTTTQSQARAANATTTAAVATCSDEDLARFLSSPSAPDVRKVEPKLATLFRVPGAATASCRFAPLQVVFRAALPTTTAAARHAHRAKHMNVRAHQERESYNRMLRGAGSTASSNSGTGSNNGVTDPSSTLHLKAASGGVGYLARDAYSSSSRAEMQSVLPATQHNLMQRLARDVGLGLDVPLMAAAGAVVGWFVCSFRGMSQDECAIGAAVCATFMLVVDAGLIMMRVAKEDLHNARDKRLSSAGGAPAADVIVAGVGGASSMAAPASAAAGRGARVVRREILSGPGALVVEADTTAATAPPPPPPLAAPALPANPAPAAASSPAQAVGKKNKKKQQ